MIVCDNRNHKVDLEFAADGWLQISTFHKKTESEWVTKVMRLSPDTLRELVKYVTTFSTNATVAVNLAVSEVVRKQDTGGIVKGDQE